MMSLNSQQDTFCVKPPSKPGSKGITAITLNFSLLVRPGYSLNQKLHNAILLSHKELIFDVNEIF
jgi:hypothetical protein